MALKLGYLASTPSVIDGLIRFVRTRRSKKYIIIIKILVVIYLSSQSTNLNYIEFLSKSESEKPINTI